MPRRHELAFTDSSAQDFFDREATHHPAAVAGLGVLEALGQGEAVRNRLLGILDEGNEDDVHFRITSPYVIAVSRPITD